MAKATGISVSSVQRIWRRYGLQPHRIRQFKLSNDPRFADKVRDIAGLCIDPPAHAVVLSIDEKSQIQALDRTRPACRSSATSASWINAVEEFFAELTKRCLKRGVFHSQVSLQEATNRFVTEANTEPRPFHWARSGHHHRRHQARLPKCWITRDKSHHRQASPCGKG
jgi:hypothetical protein